MFRTLLGAAVLALGGCTMDRPSSFPAPALPEAGSATRILDTEMADKLRNNAGVTLQWIDWQTRGSVAVRTEGDRWLLSAAQASATGPGRLYLDGRIVEIGADYFLFDGTIRITDTPDQGRRCEARKQWRFAVTQNRPYWRLREFEWCDGLTDYIDIYFPGTHA